MSTVLVDTGAWVAIQMSDDPHHMEATKFFKSKPRPRWVVTNAIVAETYTGLRYHVADPALAFRFAEEILTGDQTGRIEVIRPQRNIEIKAAALGRRFADVDLSWADLISFAVCQDFGIEQVFGFDHHFYLQGLVLLPGNA